MQRSKREESTFPARKKPKKTPLPQSNDPDIQTLTFYKNPDHPGRETTVSEPEPEPAYDPDTGTPTSDCRFATQRNSSRPATGTAT